ncbi:MAG: hypothetical protein JNM83_05360 [Myxococcales bacterium]|nr:hypothetical protein [Myxococcales bacterium]
MSSSQHSVIADARTSSRPRLSLLLCAIFVLVSLWLIAAGRKLDYVADDAYILFRHVLQHSRGLGMVWDSWHPVQAHSSILWAYLLRLGLLGGVSIEEGARLLGVGFGASSVLLMTVSLWGSLNLKRLLTSVALFATFPPLVLWSSAGLETTLALCLGLHFLSVVGRACERTVEPRAREAELLTAVLLGVLSPLVRPDLPLQLLGGLLCLFVFHARARRLIPVVVVSCVMGILVYVALNHWSYGTSVAVPVATKFRIEPRNILRFGRYVLQDAPQLVVLWLLLLAVLRKTWRQELCQDPGSLLALGVLLSTLGELMLLGGDELSRGRFLIWPFACTVQLLGRLSATIRIPKGTRSGVVLSLLLLSAAQAAWALAPEGDQPCSHWRRAAGEWLHQHSALSLTLAVAPAGYIPYYADRKTVDLMGLAHPTIGALPMTRGSEQWGQTATEIAIREGVCAVLLVVCDSPAEDPRTGCAHPTLRGMVSALQSHPEYRFYTAPIGVGNPLRLAVRTDCLPLIHGLIP